MKTPALLGAALALTSLLPAQDALVRSYASSPAHIANGPARLFVPKMPVLGSTTRVALDYEAVDLEMGAFVVGVFPANFPLYGINVLLDPTTFVATLPFMTSTAGTDVADIAIPNDPTITGTFRIQAIMIDLVNPSTRFGFMASDGMEFGIGLQEPAQTGELVITEIMQNPSFVADSDGEYIEIYNPGTADIDIEGWLIHDEDFDGVFLENGGNGIVVPAGGYRVIAVNDDPLTNGGISGAFSYGYDGYFLANGSDEVILARPDGTRVDVVRYDNGATFPDPTGASMSLCPNFLNAVDNDNGANWRAATSTIPGSTDLGTPGAANDNCL